MKIGVDLGGTTMTAGVVNEKNEIIGKLEAKTLSDEGADKVIERMTELIIRVMKESDISTISHIGLGCPGMLDRINGRVTYSNNLRWKNVDISKRIQNHFNVPVYLENDGNCAALGEYIKGSGEHSDSMVMITLGTGIGGGIIIGNRLFRGKNGNANILGHILMVSDGELCTCGRYGCWEAYASVTALIKMAGKKASECRDSKLYHIKESEGELNGENIFTAIRSGDKAAAEVFHQYVKNVSEGIIDIINIFDPQTIVIGGGISKQGELILAPVRELVGKNIYCGSGAMPRIRTSSLGNDAGIIGASCLNKY